MTVAAGRCVCDALIVDAVRTPRGRGRPRGSLCSRTGIDAPDALSVLTAGWPETVPGMTLNRICGSGQQGVSVAATEIACETQDVVVADDIGLVSMCTGGGRGTGTIIQRI